MKKIFILLIFSGSIIFSLSALNMAYAEEGTTRETDQEEEGVVSMPPGISAFPEFTKEVIIQRLRVIFQHNRDIARTIPGVERKEDESGVLFEYNGTSLKELDRETLFELWRNATLRVSLKNTRRIQQEQRTRRQSESIRRTQEIQKNLQQSRDINRLRR